MKYVLNEERLEPLDIILTKDKNLISKGIRLVTQGDYSHALIYMSSFSAIEATRDGRVFSENIQRLIFDRLDTCKVLRYKGQLTEKQRGRIGYYARSQVTTLYSIKEAVRVKALGKKDVSAMERTQFCSRLVAQAYSFAGIDLTHNSDYCSPQDLNNSELLFEVKGVLRETTEWDLNFASTPSPIKENARELYAWLDKVAILAKREEKIILNQTDAENFLQEFPEYDDEICTYILDTNYLNFYKRDEEINPFRYIFNSEIEIDIVKEFEVCKSNIDRYILNYLNSRIDLKKFPLKYFNLRLILCKDLLNQCLKQLNNIIRHADNKIALADPEIKFYMEQYKLQMTQLRDKVITTLSGQG